MTTKEEKQAEIATQQVVDQEEIDKGRKDLIASNKALEERLASFEEREDVLERDMAALQHERKIHAHEVQAFESGQAQAPEIHSAGVVKVTERMPTQEERELEDFMHEFVDVIVPKSADKEENPVIVPSVNGVNQPIWLGQWMRIRRKYIEALAHSRKDLILQKDREGKTVEGMDVTIDSALTHVFQTDNDSEKGKVWLKQLLDQPQ